MKTTPLDDLCDSWRHSIIKLYHVYGEKLPRRERAESSRELLKMELALRDYVESQKPVRV